MLLIQPRPEVSGEWHNRVEILGIYSTEWVSDKKNVSSSGNYESTQVGATEKIKLKWKTWGYATKNWREVWQILQTDHILAALMSIDVRKSISVKKSFPCEKICKIFYEVL